MSAKLSNTFYFYAYAYCYNSKHIFYDTTPYQIFECSRQGGPGRLRQHTEGGDQKRLQRQRRGRDDADAVGGVQRTPGSAQSARRKGVSRLLLFCLDKRRFAVRPGAHDSETRKSIRKYSKRAQL